MLLSMHITALVFASVPWCGSGVFNDVVASAHDRTSILSLVHVALQNSDAPFPAFDNNSHDHERLKTIHTAFEPLQAASLGIIALVSLSKLNEWRVGIFCHVLLRPKGAVLFERASKMIPYLQ